MLILAIFRHQLPTEYPKPIRSDGRDEPRDKECRPVHSNQAELGSHQFHRQFVFDVYDRIAPHFSHTRHKPWPKVCAFLRSVPPGSVLLDVGCGSGRYLPVNPSLYSIGVDRSCRFAEIAKNSNSGCGVFISDCVKLNVRSGAVDVCISIAVIHHLGTESLRMAAIAELLRCVRPGGKVLIYVWALEQDQETIGSRKFETPDVYVPWHLQRQFDLPQSEVGAGTTESGAAKVPNSPEGEPPTELDEATSGETRLVPLFRYYHVFEKTEIIDLCNRCSGATIESVTFDCNNWAVVLVKQ